MSHTKKVMMQPGVRRLKDGRYLPLLTDGRQVRWEHPTFRAHTQEGALLAAQDHLNFISSDKKGSSK